MMKNSTAFRSLVLVVYVLFAGMSLTYGQFLKPFEVRYENRVRGNMTMISNSILNRSEGWNGPNDPYNRAGNNDDMNMQYIDVDNDDNTFSSSRASLTIPDSEGCYKIVYAGLYWAGTYPSDSRHDDTREAIDQVKLRLPGSGGYMDITGEVIYDGYNSPDFDEDNSPYACYADITEYIAALDNPEGEYTLANIRAGQGSKYYFGGGSAGWTIFFVYEDLALQARFITSFDGFAAITRDGESRVDIPVSGFRTNPVGPVRANLMTLALEGDRGLLNDNFQLDAGSNGNFQYIDDNLNPANNFFNGRISVNDAEFRDRVPNSSNTLGYDATIVDITDMMDNNETQATMRFNTSQDAYYPFFSAFSAEVVMPNIRLVKYIRDEMGNDISDQEVELGGTIIYHIEFENIGNDNARDLTIRDLLPVNARADVVIDASDGVNWTYDEEKGEVVFNVEDEKVKAGNPKGWIDIQVSVSTDCSDFNAACSHIIKNQAFATYTGEDSGEVITDDPSLGGVDDCYMGEQVPVNILANTATCTFEREETLCAGELTLTAGAGFETYTWTNSEGVEVGSTQSIVVNTPGTYKVFKEVPDGSTCPDQEEIINVVLHGGIQDNPLLPEADVVETCTNDGSDLPKFFLCGAGDRRLINTGIVDVEKILWEKLDENATCGPADRDAVCANKNSACKWDTVATGPQYEIGSHGSGQYRMVVFYQGGCFSRFYFNVYTNDLDPQAVLKDIICGNPGNITIDNVPAGYEYRWLKDGAEVEPWTDGNNSLDVEEPGIYEVEIRQTGVEDGCVFRLDKLVIQQRDMKVKIEVDPVSSCGPGTIDIKVEEAGPQYYYRITNQNGDIEFVNTGAIDENRYVYGEVNDPRTYKVEVRNDAGCFYEETVEVGGLDKLELTAEVQQHIACNSTGKIQVHSSGGSTPHWYAIYSIDGALQNPVYPDDYQKAQVFDVDAGGSYTFVMMDGNECPSYSDAVLMENYPPLEYEVKKEDISCFGENSGRIIVNYTPANGFTFSYLLEDGNGNDITETYRVGDNFENLPPGSYTLTITQSRGNNTCEGEVHNITITQPDSALTATSGVSETVECDAEEGGQIRVVNAEGGTPPYEYSFDGGTDYNGDNTGHLPPGDHNIYIRDANGCVYTMKVTVPGPLTPPTATVDIGDYNCEGLAEATVNLENQNPDYQYWYAIDGVVNVPDSTSNIFTGIAPGDHIITVNYVSQIPPPPSTLMVETFGAGATVTTPYMSDAYCFEPQTGLANNCPTNSDPAINDGEYAVTGQIENPFSTWLTPSDHTGDADGRMLVVNVGDAVGVGGVVYRRKARDIIPGRDVVVSLWGLNLLRAGTGSTLGDPNLVIQLVDAGDNVVAEHATTDIPRDNGWHNFEIPLNPGNNTELDIVIRTNSAVISGNDMALDDIVVYQVPKQCPGTVDIPINIEDGKAFRARVTGVADAFCYDDAETTITFSVENYNTDTGYQYSVDNGATWETSTTSPMSVTAPVDTATNEVTLWVRYAEGECELDFTKSVAVPEAVTVTAKVTEEATCNAGAGITVQGEGGVPPYRFSIDGGATWSEEGTSAEFHDLTTGTYTVRVKDSNSCEADTEIKIDAPVALEFTATPGNCYEGDNQGQIIVEVGTGNGEYQFRINGGAWETPNPPTADSYYFTELSSGTYIIDVKDAAGCKGEPQTVVIHEELTATVTPTDINCAAGTIVVEPSGGDGNYVYAFIPAGGPVTPGDFSAASTFQVTPGNEGDYDVYIRDNNGDDGYCEYLETVTINQAPSLDTEIIPEDPQCFGETGIITVNINSGEGLYTIEITDENGDVIASLPNFANTTKRFTNIEGGTYTVTVTDRYGCKDGDTVKITEPDELTADLEAILPEDCDVVDPDEYGVRFTAYPAYPDLTVEFSVDNGATWSQNPEFTGYPSGTRLYPSMHTIDANGDEVCRIDFEEPFEVPYPPVSLVIDAKAEAVDCDFQVTVKGSEGIPPYTFAVVEGTGSPAPGDWVTPNTPPDTHVFTQLMPGRTYSFYVRDDTGCVRMNDVDIYDEFDIIDTKVTFERIPACYGEENGEITFTIEDEDGVHEDRLRWELFDINDNPVQNSGGAITYNPPMEVNVAGLAPGEYYLVVTEVDAGGSDACYGASENVLIQEARPITISGTESEPIACNAPGFVRIIGTTGGWGGYTYTISGTNLTEDIVSTENPVKIPYDKVVDPSLPVEVTIAVEDQYGCSAELGTEVVGISPAPEITTIVTNNCKAPFSLEVIASGGSGDYKYSLDGGNSYEENGGMFGNVAPGTYEVMIIDDNGCTAGPVTVEIYPLFEAVVKLTDHLDCSAAPDAEITITASGGSGSYEYEVTGNATIPRAPLTSNPFTFTVAGTGDYEVTVYDVKNGDPVWTSGECEVKSTITVTEPVKPDFTVSPTDVSCNQAEDGMIRIVAVDNGINPLTYTLNPMPAGAVLMDDGNGFENLPPGSYTVTATGTNECTTAITNVIIEQPDAIIIPPAAVSVTEFGCTSGNSPDEASVIIDVTQITGGTGTYVTYEFIEDASGDIVQSGSSSQLIWTGHSGGSFTINVYDDEGCVGTATAIIQPFDTLIDATVTATDATCETGATASVRVNTTTGNTNKIRWSLDNGDGDPGTNDWQPYGTTIDDLAPGSYVFLVRHTDTGCILPVTYTVPEPEGFEIHVEVLSDVVCPGTESGSVTFGMTDSSYSGIFEWEVFRAADGSSVRTGTHNTVNGATPPVNLGGGKYYVEIRQADVPNCTQTRAFEIAEPIGGDIRDETEVIVTPITCVRDTGTIYIRASGGWGGHTCYVAPVTAPAPGENDFVDKREFKGLTANVYQVWVKDAGGCMVELDEVALNPPEDINAGIVADPGTELQCIGDTNITLTAINVTGGSGNYLYRLNRYAADGSLESTTDTYSTPGFDGLGAGTYSITVEDNWGCTFTTETISITAPDPIVATLEIQENISCEKDAVIRISATGGTGGPYTYSADIAGPYESENTFTVGPGTYAFYVKDGSDCDPVKSNEVTINEVEDIEIELDLSAASVNCNGDATGTIRASATGGLGDYVYTLLDENQDPVPGRQNTSGIFGGLAAGLYYVQVDSGDCGQTSVQVSVTQPEPLKIEVAKFDVLCHGGNDGRIVLTTSGGTGTYKYAISPNLDQFDEKAEFDGLSAGDYTIIAQDAAGCYEEINVTITEPDALNVILSFTEETCKGDENASVTAVISGGTAPYFTSLNNRNNYEEGKLEYNGLAGGETYVVFVKDANGCETYASVSIPEGVDITPTAEIIYGNCIDSSFDNEATIKIADPGEVTRVTYALDGGIPRTGNTFTNLTPGPHTVEVVHTNGCTRHVDFEIEEREPLESVEVTSVTHVDCHGEETGSITLRATGGVGTIEYAILGIDKYQSSNVFRELPAGTYTIVARDEARCTVTTEVEIGEPAQPIRVQVVSRNEEICEGDADASVEISVSGGTPPYATSLNNRNNFVNDRFLYTGLSGGRTHIVYVRDAKGCEYVTSVKFSVPVIIQPKVDINYGCEGSYSTNSVTVSVDKDVVNDVLYKLDGAPGQLDNTFTDLAPGHHTIEVIHANGCTRPVSFIIEDIRPLRLRLEVSNLNQIRAIASGGAGGYRYYIAGVNLGEKNTYYINHTAVYTATVVDANGCKATASISMEFIDIEIPNVFTPNGDGYDDTWRIRNSEGYPDMKVIIYDRYGRELARLPQGIGWDGIYNGTLLPTGDYWYTLKLNGENDDREFVGHFTLYR
ncbi:T9SS type B sorting domain-containing protein [Sinomicrobium weinanense]|uniref:T9SS type B sorting domain-containing protein n=1 Tax=Sinomicrobium weinanense TaxID=2842200 RepID=A0A926JW80_9FLAO|nr:T9SS type B sorting domain-containing protein [Sinomicrobium weinanense]MBC9798318.1 T9SS type B sorting domain-containing protein [Sinomicrobium weinanense]MBU3125596.1 T9SS type B sorting domain-containing protein [Sinomicrobium weinanense]